MKMIGEAFKIVRVFNDMTQQELAGKLGISHSYLSQIESSKRTPTLDTVSAFSAYFRIPVSALMFFSEQLTPKESGGDMESRMAFGRKLIGLLSRIERAAH
jgi:transcriptional regulator with XRE-family HTH domain